MTTSSTALATRFPPLQSRLILLFHDTLIYECPNNGMIILYILYISINILIKIYFIELSSLSDSIPSIMVQVMTLTVPLKVNEYKSTSLAFGN